MELALLREAADDFDTILDRWPIPEGTPDYVVAGVLLNAASTSRVTASISSAWFMDCSGGRSARWR